MEALFTVEEYGQVLANAAAARMAVGAWVAEAALVPPAAPRVRPADRGLLDELTALRRQLRGACTNLNQVTARLHALGRPAGELPAIAAYVQRVAAAVEEAATWRERQPYGPGRCAPTAALTRGARLPCGWGKAGLRGATVPG